MAKAHMNRIELAELTGYSVEQIASWERGRARMYPIELVKLFHALDVKPERLLCWKRRLH
jgi:transcriptional regulator with XRE-family HTH domain